MIKIFGINFNLRIFIGLIELLLTFRYLGLLRLLSGSIEHMIRASSSSLCVELVVNLLFLLDFLFSPLYDLFDVLVLDFHEPFLVLFVEISINFLNFHHLLEDKVAVLGRFEPGRLVWLLTCFL
jgi:hypothetical protein